MPRFPFALILPGTVFLLVLLFDALSRRGKYLWHSPLSCETPAALTGIVGSRNDCHLFPRSHAAASGGTGQGCSLREAAAWERRVARTVHASSVG